MNPVQQNDARQRAADLAAVEIPRPNQTRNQAGQRSPVLGEVALAPTFPRPASGGAFPEILGAAGGTSDFDATDPDADAISEFDAQVNAEMDRQARYGREVNRSRAIAAVAQKLPRLHQAYVIATQPDERRRELAREKYEV